MADPQAPVGALPADLSKQADGDGPRWTPGPWVTHPIFPTYVVPASHISRPIGGAEDAEIDLRKYAQDICVLHIDRHRSSAERKASALLIAAAPDLYEAGRLLDLAFSDGEFAPVPDEIIAGAFGDDMLEALQKMRAALARATGASLDTQEAAEGGRVGA